MNNKEITGIIEDTLKNGNKIPGLFDLPKVLELKGKLQSSATIDEVVAIIESHRALITKAFGLNDAALNLAVDKIKSIRGQ